MKMKFPTVDSAGLAQLTAEMKAYAQANPIKDYDAFAKAATQPQEWMNTEKASNNLIHSYGSILPKVIEPYTRLFARDIYCLQLTFFEIWLEDRHLWHLNLVNTFFGIPLSDEICAEVVSNLFSVDKPTSIVETPPHVLLIFQDIPTEVPA
jgi:hypothetical protein